MNMKNHECNVIDDSNILSKKELKKLANILELFERRLVRETGVQMRSGGFASADMFRYDDDYIDIEVKWGVESGCENSIRTEQYKLPRNAVNLSASKALDQIESA